MNQALKKSGCRYVRKLLRDYVVLDLETTGGSPKNSEILEIAMVRVRDGKITAQFQTLVRPYANYIPPFITKLTGIDMNMVKDAPWIHQAIGAAAAFIGDDLIVGHNVSFDVGFLSAVTELNNEYADTVQYSRKLYPQLPNHKLSTMTNYLHLSQNTHRAMADVKATYELYEEIQREMARQNLNW